MAHFCLSLAQNQLCVTEAGFTSALFIVCLCALVLQIMFLLNFLCATQRQVPAAASFFILGQSSNSLANKNQSATHVTPGKGKYSVLCRSNICVSVMLRHKEFGEKGSLSGGAGNKPPPLHPGLLFGPSDFPTHPPALACTGCSTVLGGAGPGKGSSGQPLCCKTAQNTGEQNCAGVAARSCCRAEEQPALSDGLCPRKQHCPAKLQLKLYSPQRRSWG